MQTAQNPAPDMAGMHKKSGRDEDHQLHQRAGGDPKTSGPYSDPAMTLDVRKELPKLREQWIMARGYVEQLADLTSSFGKDRLYNSDLDHLRFQEVSYFTIHAFLLREDLS